jgi:hypothetical protein
MPRPLVLLSTLAVMTGCVLPPLGGTIYDCAGMGSALEPDEPTPFGPTGLEVAASLAKIRAHLRWDTNDDDPGPLVDNLDIQLALNHLPIPGETSVGYLPDNSPVTSKCAGPEDGLRLNMLARLASADESFLGTGNQMIYLGGPDLDPAKARFNSGERRPLYVNTSDEVLLSLATTSAGPGTDAESQNSLLVSWGGSLGDDEHGQPMEASMKFYANEERYAQSDSFAEATLEFEWLSDPLWEDGATP